MGDRNNPIKFGPEWLRNLPLERGDGRSTYTRQNSNSGPGAGSPAGASGGSGGGTATSSAATGPGSPAAATSSGATAHNAAAASSSGATATASASTSSSNGATATSSGMLQSRVLLARLRYGREEMLALYDRNATAPPELKHIDTLYQPRGKAPVALNNTFEDDMRDNMRNAPLSGGMSPSDRYAMGRGIGRGGNSEMRGRPRAYLRPPVGRGASWNTYPRLLFSGSADDDAGPSRSWNNNNTNNRNSGDQPDFLSRMFKRRQGNNTNWRQQHTSDEGEEWRSTGAEPARTRQAEKWQRDYRSGGEKTQSWGTNRRTWVGGDTQNNEEIPEWVGENAECGGTFDSSGAFHGYSNDDSNLPKHKESSYPLTKSHTHGSFARSKTVEEGSDEWWASEKAKKLSPKRFDASDIKFNKKQPTMGTAEAGPSPSSSKEYANKSNFSKEEFLQDMEEKPENGPPPPEQSENNAQNDEAASFKNKFSESKTFDAMMRSDINMDEATDERGNFQSVIITPNNSLRQKHQHLVAADEIPTKLPAPNRQNSANKHVNSDMDHGRHEVADELLGGMFVMEQKEILPPPPPHSLLTLTNTHNTALVSPTSSKPLNMQLNMPTQGLQMDGNYNNQNMQASVHQMHGMSPARQSGMQHGMPSPGMQPSNPAAMQQPLQSNGQQGKQVHQGNQGMTQMGMQTGGMRPSGMQNMSMHNVMQMPAGLQNPGNPGSSTRGQNPVMQSSLMQQQLGIANSGLNAALGLPRLANMGMPRLPEGYANVANDGMASLDAAGMQSGMSMQVGNMPGYHGGNSNLANNSLFLRQGSNNPMSPPSEIPMPNHGGQNMYPMHGPTGSQAAFGSSLYNNSNVPNPSDKWFYEDPKGNIQGPFSSKEMFNWYRAGFFSSTLMVRRSYETVMRPLGSYPGVPFAHMDLLPPFPCFEPRPRRGSDAMLNSQAVMKMNMPDNARVENLQFGSVGQMTIQSFNSQQAMVDLLWGQSSEDLMWMQQPINARNEGRVNNLPMYFWDRQDLPFQPSAITSNSLLPEEITKEMKTEDQILAQLRASQNIPQPPSLSFIDPPSTTPVVTTLADDCFAAAINATPNLEELHRLIQKDTLTGNTLMSEPEIPETQTKPEKNLKQEPTLPDTPTPKTQTKATPEPKPAKQKAESEKAAKNKENNATKAKAKKSKEEKKDEVVEVKTKDDEIPKVEKRSQESSPAKTKKEDKINKKELEKEKKEWIKEGFTIVKGPEKATTKDGKKKAEEARAAEEAERKRKEEEKVAADEEKKNKKKMVEVQKEVQKKQQEQQQQRQAADSVAKKAPWSSMANLTQQAVHKDGLTLGEIQRLEREKKLEQMKEQQQMMQIIAQQQAAALAREQEMQAGLGWAKKKANNFNAPGQSLAEIQAEARKQAVAAAFVQVQTIVEETQIALPPPNNHVPWSNTLNGGGFWDTQPNPAPKPEKTQQEPPKPVEPIKPKKKLTLTVPAKKETSPAAEFEAWCTTFLAPWNAKIDVPTFVGFLKDIESPYEVKDYVKCYIGDSKESNDFARQFLERRSKLLRVGMITPSDDLCSPAIAINPRTPSNSDYQEVKGKGKKTKKNKMLKVDARILGFSVTASEDRINVGDIDTV